MNEGNMQEMTLQHTTELERFYKEHRKNCTNCEREFTDGDCAHLGYIKDRKAALFCDECAHLLEETVVRYQWEKLEYEEPLMEDKLWRYMDLSKFISIISRKDLFFASANTFEDPFEGAKGIIDRKKVWDDFYLDFFQKAILTAPRQDVNELTVEKIRNDSERLLKQLNTIGESARNNTYISCWHMNEYESEAMWKMYSRDVTNAIAIQTTAGHLYDALCRNPSIAIGKVKYIDFEKQFTSINGAFWYKRKSFEYEREVRAVLRQHNIKENGIYVPIDINVLIDKIYISPYASEWFVDVVKSIVEKYKVEAPILYSQMLVTPFY